MGHSLIQPVYNIEMWWRFFIKWVACVGVWHFCEFEKIFFGGFDLLVLDLKLRLDFDFVLGFDIFVNLRRFFLGFWFVGFGFWFEAEIGFWFCVDVDFWYGSWRQVLWFGFKYSNETICCVLLSLNENLFWLLVTFNVFFFSFLFVYWERVLQFLLLLVCLLGKLWESQKKKNETEGDRWEKEESFGIELKIGNGVICRLGLRTEVVSF